MGRIRIVRLIDENKEMTLKDLSNGAKATVTAVTGNNAATAVLRWEWFRE